jgi:hypothetical protein
MGARTKNGFFNCDQKPADTFFPPYDEFKNQTLISEGVSQGYPYQILKFTK